MHELSLCHAIVEVVRPHAGVRRIDTVHLRVGALRQVVPETLMFCWDIVAAQEDLGGAALDIDWVEATVTCADCTTTSPITSRFSIACPGCGSARVGVLTGEEFLVTSIDVAALDVTAPVDDGLPVLTKEVDHGSFSST
ncbi:hydrogenase maturation nickel metallochaperone HypA [Gordonia sp. i37]|uniref:hydrogenase maturation nickel metallochaperone HypA n=1 Tax=Gordonia sp. i37 TaxID=1961707 RepID=UPI00209B7DAD|nr:hydrogenase maturation nickel metallochaperone HypA [Gordonia sp. i37]